MYFFAQVKNTEQEAGRDHGHIRSSVVAAEAVDHTEAAHMVPAAGHMMAARRGMAVDLPGAGVVDANIAIVAAHIHLAQATHTRRPVVAAGGTQVAELQDMVMRQLRSRPSSRREA